MFWYTKIRAVQDTEFDAIIDKLTRSYLDAPATPCVEITRPGGEMFAARINISGWLDGIVELSASVEDACALAARMTGTCNDPLLAAETLAEMTNTFAGAVKSILGEGLQLDLPHVSRGEDPVGLWPSFVRSYEVAHSTLTLVLWDATPQSAPAPGRPFAGEWS